MQAIRGLCDVLRVAAKFAPFPGPDMRADERGIAGDDAERIVQFVGGSRQERFHQGHTLVEVQLDLSLTILVEREEQQPGRGAADPRRMTREDRFGVPARVENDIRVPDGLDTVCRRRNP